MSEPAVDRRVRGVRHRQRRHRARRATCTRSPSQLLRDADAAMYQAKDRGRARYELFDPRFRTSGARPARHRERTAPRARPARSCACTTSRSFDLATERDRRRRGAAALGAPRARPAAARRVPRRRRGDRPDRADRRVGARTRRAGRSRRLADALRSAPGSSRWRSTSRRARSPTRASSSEFAEIIASTDVDPALLDARDHREHPDGRRGAVERDARPAQGARACAWRSTTSAPGTRRSPTCSASRSTCSRSTARSSPGWAPSRDAAITGAIVTLVPHARPGGRGRGGRDRAAVSRARPHRLRPGTRFLEVAPAQGRCAGGADPLDASMR